MDKPKKELKVMYQIVSERLRENRDPYGVMGFRDIQICLGRMFHVPKQESPKLIRELQELGLIELMGRNNSGLFYKIN